MISHTQKNISFRMIYVSKVDIKRNTARAKHIRSLIAAESLIKPSLKFVFYSYKKPLKNLSTLKILFFNSFYKKHVIYTRDIEFALIAAITGVRVIYEIHHFGIIRNSTRFGFLNKLIMYYLSNKNFVRYVTLTKNSARVLKYIFPKIIDSRVYIIPDAGGLTAVNYSKNNLAYKNNEEKIVLSYAGSFMPGKGGLETIFLASKLRKYQFNLAGNLDPKIIEQIKDLNNVKFFGYLKDYEIDEFYNSVDILIAPIGRRIFLDKELKNEITFYTSPLKLYEYSFTSKPIITIDRPCTRIFRDMPGVWFVDKNKENCLNTWQSIINDVYKRKKDTSKLLEERQKHIFTWEKRLIEMLKIK